MVVESAPAHLRPSMALVGALVLLVSPLEAARGGSPPFPRCAGGEAGEGRRAHRARRIDGRTRARPGRGPLSRSADRARGDPLDRPREPALADRDRRSRPSPDHDRRGHQLLWPRLVAGRHQDRLFGRGGRAHRGPRRPDTPGDLPGPGAQYPGACFDLVWADDGRTLSFTQVENAEQLDLSRPVRVVITLRAPGP